MCPKLADVKQKKSKIKKLRHQIEKWMEKKGTTTKVAEFTIVTTCKL